LELFLRESVIANVLVDSIKQHGLSGNAPGCFEIRRLYWPANCGNRSYTMESRKRNYKRKELDLGEIMPNSVKFNENYPDIKESDKLYARAAD
jgi:hypothetical protein